MDQAGTRRVTGESEPVWALGTRRGRRFVDWAALLSVSTMRKRAHFGLCSPTNAPSVADRSLSGSTLCPEFPRDDQVFSSQPTIKPTHDRASPSCGVMENGTPTPFSTASATTTTSRKDITT